MTTLRVEPEAGRRDAKAFLELPYRLYKGHPIWVPPLRMAEKGMFDRRRNPFFAHADVQHFLARRGRRVVGRIAAIHNHLHNETYNDAVGFFGFFDVESDPEATAELLDAARRWLAARGLERMRGPMNYSTNDTCGVLIGGFEHPPMVLMPYNREDYDELLLGAGLEAEKDLLAFRIEGDTPLPERFVRVVERRMARTGIVIRPIDIDDVKGEIKRLSSVYNRCWSDNWGFVPATAEEFMHAAKDMKPLLYPTLSGVAELDGEVIGLSLIVRNLNELLPGTNGRLLPKALPRLLFRLKKVRTARIVALGVVPEHRGRGVNEAFFLRALRESLPNGVHHAEAGWILEDNEKMQAPIKMLGARAWKRYRVYITKTVTKTATKTVTDAR